MSEFYRNKLLSYRKIFCLLFPWGHAKHFFFSFDFRILLPCNLYFKQCLIRKIYLFFHIQATYKRDVKTCSLFFIQLHPILSAVFHLFLALFHELLCSVVFNLFQGIFLEMTCSASFKLLFIEVYRIYYLNCSAL